MKPRTFILVSLVVSYSAFAAEVPTAYTSDQLRDLAKTQSFSSKLEFDNVISTKLTAKTQYLNLLPHLSNVSIGVLATFSGVLGTLDAIGDLVPFLLPDRWLQAKQADQLAQAEQFASQIMQLDAGETVEGLALAAAQNIDLHSQLKEDLAEIQKIEAAITDPERSLSIASVDNELQQTISNLESTMALQMTELAQAAGFTNPEAISSVSAGSLGDINHPANLQLDAMQAQVVKNSPEINQLNLLIAASKTAGVGRYFQWMDPSGDPQGGLGAAFPDYVQIGATSTDELQISMQQLNATLLHEITDAYNNYAGWIESYQLAVAGVSTQNKRVSLAQPGLRSSGEADFSAEELRDALNLLTQNHIAQISAQYAWYATVSQINRLLLQGPYQVKSN